MDDSFTLFPASSNSNYIYDKKLINKIYRLIIKDQKKLKESPILKNQWQTITKLYRDILLSEEKYHIVRLPTGAGKTAGIIQWLIYIMKLTGNLSTQGLDGIVLLGQEYENNVDEFERQIEKFTKEPVSYVRLEGKWRNCCNNPKSETYKTRIGTELIESGIQIGLPINYICENCPYKNTECEYYENTSEILDKYGTKFWMGVSHQLNKFLLIFLKKAESVLLVIDENFENSIKNSFRLNIEMINENREFLQKVYHYLLKEDKIKISGYTRISKKTGKETKIEPYDRTKKPDPFLLCDLFYLFKLLRLLKKKINGRINLKELKDTLEIFESDNEKLLAELIRVAWILNNKKELKLSRFIYFDLLNLIQNYVHKKKIDPKNLDKWLNSAIVRIEKKEQEESHYKNEEGNGKKQLNPYLSFVYYDVAEIYKLNEEGRIAKLIINDATASKRRIESLLGIKLKIHEKNLTANEIEYHQLKIKVNNPRNPTQEYAWYYMKSLKVPSTIRNLYQDIKAIVDAFPEKAQILLISRKSENIYLKHYGMYLWDYLKLISPKLIFESYPLTSTNVYENIDVVIELGTPVLAEYVVERESNLLNENPEAIRQEYPRNSMLQGMGRIFRGTNKKYVFILSGIDLELKNPIINHNSHKELRKYMNEMAKRKAKSRIKDNKLKIIYAFLETHKNQITSDKYARMFKVSVRTARYKLKQYQNLGKLKSKSIGSAHKLVYYK